MSGMPCDFAQEPDFLYDALQCKLWLLKDFIELKAQDGVIPSALAEDMRGLVEELLADSASLAAGGIVLS